MAKSKFIENEWRQALRERGTRPDPYFMRPVYKHKAEDVPEELQGFPFIRI